MDFNNTWQILIVDDDEELCELAEEALNRAELKDSNFTLEVETLTDFNQALQRLASKHFDIVILDVRLQNIELAEGEGNQGRIILDNIRQHIFIPIIFYTALPSAVADYEESSPLIQVIQKSRGVDDDGVLDAIENLIESQLIQVNRALKQHIDHIQRDYMWNFVMSNWRNLIKKDKEYELAYFLARRLALSLSSENIEYLAQKLGHEGTKFINQEKIHPNQYYIMPPIEKQSPRSGNIYRIEDKYQLLLTPSCDMVLSRPKVEYVLMSTCDLLTEQKEYKDWTEDNSKKSKLMNLLNNRREKRQSDRFFYLPGTLSLPDLIADFLQIRTYRWDDLKNQEPVASLDSPFSEEVVWRFSNYFGRLGTPDLDADHIIENLE